MAAMSGMGNCVAPLVEAKAKLDQQNASGETPLHLAAAMERLEAIRALVVHKADMEIKNIKGETAMNCAAGAMAKGAIILLQDLGAYGNWAPLAEAPDLPLRIFLTAPFGVEAERKAFMSEVSLS